MPPAVHGAPVQSRKATRQADQRAFLRKVSHELRTPLNSIVGFSEMLACELYGPLGAPQYREYAEIIHDSGHRLLKLVDQLVEVARLQTGTVEWDIGREPLGPAIEQAVADQAEALAARGLRLDCAGPWPAALADPHGLSVILTGVIGNAIALSPQGGAIRIRGRRRNGFAEIRLEHAAEHLTPDALRRLLDPFAKGATSITAGLALPIAALTCQALGGRLSLRRKPSGDLLAVVRLPAASQAVAPAPASP